MEESTRVQDSERHFRMARKLGFDNINMDLIAGLPGEDTGGYEGYACRQIEELGPDSLTVHSLAIKRAAQMGQEKSKPALRDWRTDDWKNAVHPR